MLRINKIIAARTERDSFPLFRTVTSHVSEQLGPEQEKSKTKKKQKPHQYPESCKDSERTPEIY